MKTRYFAHKNGFGGSLIAVAINNAGCYFITRNGIQPSGSENYVSLKKARQRVKDGYWREVVRPKVAPAERLP